MPERRQGIMRSVTEATPLPDAVPPTPRELAFEEFGDIFLRRVLHTDRVLESVDRILGPDFKLGPMGAGPGRKVATLTANGRFLPTYGELLPGDDVVYRVMLPVDVTFDLDIVLETQRFHADVLVPLLVRLRLVEPLTIVWDIEAPAEDEVQIEIRGETRRSSVLQKMAGFDSELRRFLVRFVERELNKPYVQRARHIDIVSVIDGAWEQIACQFLPNGPEDRV
jgi:hypothetical protein